MEETKTNLKANEMKKEAIKEEANPKAPEESQAQAGKIKTRQGSGYLKQLYSTARTTAGTTHSHLKNLTTFLVNFIPVEKVDASELQVRVHFDDAEITALSASIKEHGVLQPILVVQDGDRYKVIAGERRLRASKMAGLDRIPARVLSTNDKATHEIALRENLDRVDLHPIEEGEGYLSLLEAQAYTSHDSIAKAFGKPKSRITECIGFTRLPQTTKEELLKTGIKNRSLLRQLLTIDPAQHLSMIREVMGKEEVLETRAPVTMDSTAGESEVNPAGASKEKAPIRPFSYQITTRSISVPSFKWKKKSDKEILRNYLEALKKLIAELEPLA